MEKLFEPVLLGNTVLLNRVAFAPIHIAAFTDEDGFVSQKTIAHYKERAEGEVGLIIIEATCIDPLGKLNPRQLGLFKDAQIEGFKKLIDACHREGSKVLVQLHHGGLQTHPAVTTTFLAPSRVPFKSHYNGCSYWSKTLTVPQIHSLQKSFLQGAIRAQKAGADGVELHGAHGYLISQFFSPITNKRKDSYGGIVENRVRFVAEIVEKIKKELGKDFLVTCRMGGNEPTLEEGIAIAKALEKTGIDLLHISSGIGYFNTDEVAADAVTPKYFPYNWITYMGTEIKKRVVVPVMVVNHISTKEEATYLIENNLADYVALGRSLLVDSKWVKKSKKKKPIVTCHFCKKCMWAKSRDTTDYLCPAEKSRISV